MAPSFCLLNERQDKCYFYSAATRHPPQRSREGKIRPFPLQDFSRPTLPVFSTTPLIDELLQAGAERAGRRLLQHSNSPRHFSSASAEQALPAGHAWPGCESCRDVAHLFPDFLQVLKSIEPFLENFDFRLQDVQLLVENLSSNFPSNSQCKMVYRLHCIHTCMFEASSIAKP